MHDSTNSGTTESPTNPTKTNSLSPTLCSIADPAFTIIRPSLLRVLYDKATHYTASSEGHDYAVRLCGPLPDKTCGANAGIYISSCWL